MASAPILEKCKETIEKLQADLQSSTEAVGALQSENARLRETLEQAQSKDQPGGGQTFSQLKEDYLKELDKNSQLEGALLKCKESLLRTAENEQEGKRARERAGQLEAEVSRLRGRVSQLEESHSSREELVKEWGQTVQQFEVELEKVVQENYKFQEEREATIGTVKQVLKMVYEARDEDFDEDGNETGRTSLGGLELVSQLKEAVIDVLETATYNIDLGSMVEEKDNHIKKLQNELQNIAKKYEKAELEMEQIRVDEAEEMSNQMSHQKLQQLSQENEYKNQEIQKLVDQVEKYETMLEEQVEMVNKYGEMLDQEKSNFEDQIATFQEDINRLLSENNVLQQKLAQTVPPLEANLRELSESNSKYQSKVKSLKEQNEALTQRLHTIEEELEQLTVRNCIDPIAAMKSQSKARDFDKQALIEKYERHLEEKDEQIRTLVLTKRNLEERIKFKDRQSKAFESTEKKESKDSEDGTEESGEYSVRTSLKRPEGESLNISRVLSRVNRGHRSGQSRLESYTGSRLGMVSGSSLSNTASQPLSQGLVADKENLYRGNSKMEARRETDLEKGPDKVLRVLFDYYR